MPTHFSFLYQLLFSILLISSL